MGMRGAVLAVVSLALVVAPAASAQHTFTVGYRTPSTLHGLDVVTRVPALHLAEVRAGSAASLRARPGIRWVERARLRTHASEPALVPWAANAEVPEWQYAATRVDLVPAWISRAASSVTIAVVDTGADVTAPDIA